LPAHRSIEKAQRSRTKPVAGARLAEDLSVSALLFQAQTLLDRLETFTDNEYPSQAVTVAQLLRLLANRAHSELLRLDESPQQPLTRSDYARARDLGSIVHVLHAYIRYLQASDPLRSPPGVQHAISLLISTHGQAALGCDSGDINVLVRPQWTYNLKYIDIIHQFETDAECDLNFALDPDRQLDADDARSLIEALWEQTYRLPGEIQSKETPLSPNVPKHVAVLSFAGLDHDNVLLYPLLAHELGHFLDFESDDIDNLSTDSATEKYLPTTKEIAEAGLPQQDKPLLVETIRVCLREITADLLAARMAGLGYLFAFAEFFKTLTPWPGPLINPDSGYPGFGLRLKLIWEELASNEAGIQSIQALRKVLARWQLPGNTTLKQYIARSQERVQSVRIPLQKTPSGAALVQKAVTEAIPAIQQLVRLIIPADKAARLPMDIEDMVGLLADRIPPFQPRTRSLRQKRKFKPWSFHEILTAGWLYQIAIGEKCERNSDRPENRFREYQNTCLLLLKALELEGSGQAILAINERNRQRDTTFKGVSMSRTVGKGVISGPSQRAALDRKTSRNRLVLCPDFGDGPIESASRDLHLGHWFRVSKRTSLVKVDIAYSADRAKARRQGQSELFVSAGGDFVLQPGDFALGASMEYIYLPPDMMAFVEGKSSLGRAGLLIATATQVAPGFKGCIVLELFNAGTVPVILRPAMRVAQLVLISTDSNVPKEWLYSGAFQVQIKP